MTRNLSIGIVAAVSALVISAPAYAGGSGSLAPLGGSDPLSQEYSFSDTLAAGSFTDTYNFTLPTNNGANVPYVIDFFFAQNAASTRSALANITSVTVDGVALTLDKTIQSSTVAGHTTYNLVVDATNAVKTYAIASHKLHTLTPQTLVISGTAGSNDSYSGFLEINAVPEPSTWALMLGGLAAAAMAVFAQRRRGFADA